MARLFDGGGWLGPLALNAIAAHAAAAVLRRRGVSLPLAAVGMVLGGIVMISWTCYLSTTIVGIPTGETWSTVGDDLSAAWSPRSEGRRVGKECASTGRSRGWPGH